MILALLSNEANFGNRCRLSQSICAVSQGFHEKQPGAWLYKLCCHYNIIFSLIQILSQKQFRPKDSFLMQHTVNFSLVKQKQRGCGRKQ